MTLQFGDVVLIRMDFHQTAGAKVRPAVVMLDTGDEDFVAAPITSQVRNSNWDLRIEQWQKAGLNAASYTRAHKLAVLAKADIARQIGSLASEDRVRLNSLLCDALCHRTKT